MNRFFAVVFITCLLFNARVMAAPAGGVERIPTRSGVTVPVYEVWNPQAVATLVLFSGGGGGYGKLGEDGWPSSGNFLIRSAKLWAAHPFNLVMVGRPSDGIDLANGRVRTGEDHMADNIAVLKTVRAHSDKPIWLVGTSMGTISAASAAINDEERLVAGVVLTSSILSSRIPGAVTTQDLGRIRVPVLVVHHAYDSCFACPPGMAGQIISRLDNAPRKELVLIKSGGGATGGECEAFHYHGYIGAEQETVDGIARWILQAPR